MSRGGLAGGSGSGEGGDPIAAAVSALRSGRAADAEALVRRVLRSRPQHAVGQRVLGEALAAQGKLDAASQAWRAVLRAKPGDGEARRRLARLLHEGGRTDEAAALWRDATRLAPKEPGAHWVAAEYELAGGRADAARSGYERVLALAPGHAMATLRLGQLEARFGHTDAARARLEPLADTGDGDPAGEAAALLAELDRREGDPRRAVERLRPWRERAQAGGLGPAAIGGICTQLGLALDATDAPEEAFTHFERAQSALALGAGVTPEACAPIDRLLDTLEAWTTTERVGAWADPPDAPMPKPPVFLVGFPRSGTTLLEQMLGAHAGITPSDERSALQPVREGMVERFGLRPEFPAMLDDLTPSQLRQARRDYLQRMARTVGAGRVLDKQPLNTADLVVVRRLFPESPVLCMVRDPRDTVLSCFMQHFSRGLPHLFDLEATAALYARLMRLSRVYRSALGLRWLDVRYEDLAADPGSTLRAVLEHLDEPWDEGVLRSHEPEHRRYVSTPTYGDVQRPAHTRAVGRWRRYADPLAPVLPTLAPWVEAFGYDAG